MAYVFIFPSSEQFTLIQSMAANAADAVIVVTDGGWQVPPAANIQICGEQEFLAWAQGRSGDSWLCFHERAVFFASCHRDLAGELPFDPVCLDMLTKLEMDAHLRAAGVPVLSKIRLEEFLKAPTFPVVVKPNLGFASTLVKRVSSLTELETYRSRYQELRQASLIPGEQNHFLSHRDQAELEQIIVEPDASDGLFLTVPFIVREGGHVAAFPILGTGITRTDGSDFLWTRHRAPVTLPEQAQRSLDEVLRKLAKAFARGDAVFEAEILMAPDGTPWVLEFSPRVTGGSLPRLLYHAYGLNLDQYAIGAMLKRSMAIPTHQEFNHCTLTRRYDRQAPEPEGDSVVLESCRKRVGDQLFVDEIRSLASDASARSVTTRWE